MQKSLFLKNALVVTMDRDRRELQGAHVHILDGKIHDLGVNLPTPRNVDETVDLSGFLVCPGLVNIHHVSKPDPGGALGAGCQSLPMAQDALSDLVEADA
jgi:predicted amidohydrolase